MNKKISVVIADAQMLVRIGLKHVLSESPDFAILDIVEDEKELLDSIKKKQPNVVISVAKILHL